MQSYIFPQMLNNVIRYGRNDPPKGSMLQNFWQLDLSMICLFFYRERRNNYQLYPDISMAEDESLISKKKWSFFRNSPCTTKICWGRAETYSCHHFRRTGAGQFCLPDVAGLKNNAVTAINASPKLCCRQFSRTRTLWFIWTLTLLPSRLLRSYGSSFC